MPRRKTIMNPRTGKIVYVDGKAGEEVLSYRRMKSQRNWPRRRYDQNETETVPPVPLTDYRRMKSQRDFPRRRYDQNEPAVPLTNCWHQDENETPTFSDKQIIDMQTIFNSAAEDPIDIISVQDPIDIISVQDPIDIISVQEQDRRLEEELINSIEANLANEFVNSITNDLTPEQKVDVLNAERELVVRWVLDQWDKFKRIKDEEQG